MSANDKTTVGSGSGNWRTPPDLFARLDRRYQFNYDAFASHKNALPECGFYSTAQGTFQVTAQGVAQRSERDGLDYDWMAARVFVQPPYSRAMLKAATQKAASERERAQIIVGLLPANTDTAWFHDFVLPYADVEFLRGRINFIHPDEPCKAGCKHEYGVPTKGSPGGSMIVVWRPA